MKKRIKAISLSTIFALFLLWQGYENWNVEIHVPLSNGEEHVLSMPRKDKKSLEFFLRYIICWDVGGYVLLGNKPMFMGIYHKPFSTYDRYFFLESISPWNLRIIHGWKTFQKYQHLFLNDHTFSIWIEDNPFFGENSPIVIILLVNRQRLSQMVSRYNEDFQQVLGRPNITGDELLAEAKNKPFLGAVLKCHNGLIGTLFGYGRDNAWLFEARDHGIIVPLSSLWGDEITEFYAKKYENYGYFSPIRLLGNFPKDLSEYLSYVYCAANQNSSETQELKQEVLKTREKILKYYQDENFLEATLRGFMEGA